METGATRRMSAGPANREPKSEDLGQAGDVIVNREPKSEDLGHPGDVIVDREPKSKDLDHPGLGQPVVRGSAPLRSRLGFGGADLAARIWRLGFGGANLAGRRAMLTEQWHTERRAEPALPVAHRAKAHGGSAVGDWWRGKGTDTQICKEFVL